MWATTVRSRAIINFLQLMISIIICSVNSVLLQKLRANIENSIGVPYEIIAIDNSVSRQGICKVYNDGGRQARFPFLCFVHEDVLFETMNWGQQVCHHLSDERTGLIGVAGGDTKGIVPSSWSVPVISNEINIVQHSKTPGMEGKKVFASNPHDNAMLKKVVALDGVLLCVRKNIFDHIKFDETTFTGFHGYDIDYSLQVGRQYNVCVSFAIIIHHYSEGNPDKKWIESAVRLSEKWKHILPISIHDVSKASYERHHWHSLQVYLKHLFRLHYNYLQIMRAYIYYSFSPYFSLRRFASMGKFVFVNILSNLRSKLKNEEPA